MHYRGTAIFIGIVYLLAGLMVLAIPVSSHRYMSDAAFGVLLGLSIWMILAGIGTMLGSILAVRHVRAARVLLLIAGLMGLDYYVLRVRKLLTPPEDEKTEDEPPKSCLLP